MHAMLGLLLWTTTFICSRISLRKLAFLQRNVFADIIKRKEVMALPNLAEDLAYVSLLCVCIARSLLRAFIDFVARGFCVMSCSWAL